MEQFKAICDNAFEKELTPSLSVAASINGKCVLKEYRGTRFFDDPESDEINETHVFNVGSVTKPITGALVYKLIDEKLIRLDDLVSKFLDCPHYGKITIKHLITHTGRLDTAKGIPDWPKTKEEATGYFNAIHQLKPLETNLGDAMNYFTHGYSLLMEIIEKVTSMPIESFANKTLFDPLAMTSSHYDIGEVDINKLILPHKQDKGLLEEYLEAPPTGDSGLLSNVNDLLLFGNMFLGYSPNTVLKEETLHEMMQESTGNRFFRASVFFHNGNDNVELCFGKKASLNAVGHPGFTGCHLMIDPDRDLVVAITTNGCSFHSDFSNYGEICDIF